MTTCLCLAHGLKLESCMHVPDMAERYGRGELGGHDIHMQDLGTKRMMINPKKPHPTHDLNYHIPSWRSARASY